MLENSAAFLMKGDGFLVPLQPCVNFKKPNQKYGQFIYQMAIV